MGAYSDAFDRWVVDLETANEKRILAQTSHGLLAAVYIDSFLDARTAQSHIVNCLQNILIALQYLSYWPVQATHESKLHSKLSQILDDPPWDGDAYVLTWEKIVAAWANADVTGRLFTILSIDAMRTEIWDEPVSFFNMRKGLGGS